MFTYRITSVFANKLKHAGLVLEFVRQRCDSSANCVMWSASSRSLLEHVWNPFLAPFTSFTSFTIRGFGSKFPAGLPLSKPGSVTFWSVTGCDHKHRIRCQQNKIKQARNPSDAVEEGSHQQSCSFVHRFANVPIRYYDIPLCDINMQSQTALNSHYLSLLRYDHIQNVAKVLTSHTHLSSPLITQ